MPLFRVIAVAHGVGERLFDDASLVDLLRDLRLELALPVGELFGGCAPFMCRTRVGRFESGFSVGEPAFEIHSSRGRAGKQRGEFRFAA